MRVQRQRLDVHETVLRRDVRDLRRRVLPAAALESANVVVQLGRRLRAVVVDGVAELGAGVGQRERQRVEVVVGGLRQRLPELVEQRARVVVQGLRGVVVRAQQVVKPVPAGDGEPALRPQQARSFGEQPVIVVEVLDQTQRRDGVELAVRQPGLVVLGDDPLQVDSLCRCAGFFDHPRRAVDADAPPADARRVHAELSAAAAEVDDPAVLGERGRDALDREADALRANGKPDIADVSGFHPRLRVPVEVVLDVILHGAKLASARMGSVFVIAEAGMNHDGSLGNAIRFAEVAAECGADAVKFQLHDPDAETTRDAPSPPYFQHETRWEYFRRTAFTDEQWATLKEACDRAEIEFLCSVFSVEAVERLEQLGVRRYKIGSGEVTNLELVRRVGGTGRPVLLTSGMSSWAELDAAVAAAGNDVTVLQCTSSYPTPPDRVGLNVLGELRERYGKPVGFSDHTLGNYAAFAAVTLGAVVVEKHFTLSKDLYGPDAAFASEPDEFEDLVEGIRDIEEMLANPVDKDDLEALTEMKLVFEKSVVTVAAIPAGATIERGMLAAKKPGTGIPAAKLDDVVGRRAARDLPADTVVTEDALA